MKYLEVKIYTSREGIDPLTCILMDMGIAGFAIFDPQDIEELLEKKNSYDWDYVDPEVMSLKDRETSVTFYLEDTEANKELLQRVKIGVMKLRSDVDYGVFGADANFGRLYVSTEEVQEEDWKDNWKEYFKPAKITDRIVIKPTWETYERASEEELILEIDPGMAFGTGTHATTSLCVKLMEKYMEPSDVVLDVGCGSGILSIAAGLLGADKVYGVDIDPVAVAVAKENVALNHLEGKTEIFAGDLTKGLDLKADIVVANLMADLVVFLSEDAARHLQGKSIYISSGILAEKQPEVAKALDDYGFDILETCYEGEWCAIAARPKGLEGVAVSLREA